MADQLVYLKEELPAVVGLGASTIEREIAEGRFPPPRQLSPGRVGWLAWEIFDWLDARPVSKILPPANTGAKKPRAGSQAAPA